MYFSFYLSISGKYSGGCKTLRHLSRNIELEESGIKMDKGTGLERRYSEVCVVINIIYLSIYPSIYSSMHPSIHLSIHPCIHLSIY